MKHLTLMTDLEKMKEVFTNLKVKYKVVNAKEEQGESPNITEYDGKITWDTAIKLNNGIGYYSFECLFYFLDGKYQGHGVWE